MNRPLRRRGVWLWLLLAGVSAACAPDPLPIDDDASELEADLVTPAPPTTTIDPARVAEGDTIAGLQVTRSDLAPAVGEQGTWVGEVRFGGRIRVTGAYRAHPFDPESEELCFFPDSASASRLPRLPYDERISWFCFSNRAEATEILGEPGGAAPRTVTIDDFRYLYSRTDVYNLARLISSDSVSRPAG